MQAILVFAPSLPQAIKIREDEEDGVKTEGEYIIWHQSFVIKQRSHTNKLCNDQIL